MEFAVLEAEELLVEVEVLGPELLPPELPVEEPLPPPDEAVPSWEVRFTPSC